MARLLEAGQASEEAIAAALDCLAAVRPHAATKSPVELADAAQSVALRIHWDAVQDRADEAAEEPPANHGT